MTAALEKAIVACSVPNCHDPQARLEFGGRRPPRHDLAKLGTGLTGWACQGCFQQLRAKEKRRKAEAEPFVRIEIDKIPLAEVKARVEHRGEIVPLRRTREHHNGRRVNRRPVPLEATPGTWTGRLVRDWDRRDYAAIVTGLGDGEDEE